jgi:hypothetical protein
MDFVGILLNYNVEISFSLSTTTVLGLEHTIIGADPGFQVRGGAHKKIAPSGGRREHCCGISCEKHLARGIKT